MRGWAAIFVAMAGCYAPRAPSGAPCASDGTCPAPLACRDSVCVAGPEIDAAQQHPDGDTVDLAIDMSTIDGPPNDLDGDGIPNAADNCPNKPNASQGDEDADGTGDVCDSCPIFATSNPSDPDGDGVSDVCDIRPNTPGDHIDLFDGFDTTAWQAWMQDGTWSAVPATTKITLAANNNDSAYLVLPVPLVTRGAIAFAGTLDQINGTTSDADLGIRDPFNAGNEEGVACELYKSSGSSQRHVDLWNYVTDTSIGTVAYAWAENTKYVVSLVRDMSNYLCRVLDPQGMSHDAMGNASPNVNNPVNAIRGFAVDATIDWVMVVSY